MTTRVFYDCEFIEDGRTIDLISIGMVSDTGAEYYAVSADFDFRALVSNQWLLDHVWPSLPQVRGDVRLRVLRSHRVRGLGSLTALHKALFDWNDPAVKHRDQIADDVRKFITQFEYPQLWAWYAAYDHVTLAQLFGRMIDLPPGIPMYTCDLKQECDRLGNPTMPQQVLGVHNALADARHNLLMARYLDQLAVQR